MPVKDLYDSQMMLATIQAARDLYKDRRQDLKDFYDQYGDFVSPIAGDQEYWNNNIVGPTQDAINQMYENGIDPLRSREGAMMLAQLRNKINKADVARLKTRANNAIDWYKAMGQLRQKGLYNEDFSRFLEETPDQWASDFMGYSSPTAYDDLNAHTSHWFDNVNKNGYIGTKDGYDIYGVRAEDLNAAMDSQIPDFVNSDYGRYQLELAKRQAGPFATQDQIMDRLRSNIVSANKELTINPTRQLNEQVKMQMEIEKDRQKQANEFYYWKKQRDYQIAHPLTSKSKTGNPNVDGEYDSAEGLFNTGLSYSGGASEIEDPTERLSYARDHIIDRQHELIRNARASYNNAEDQRDYIMHQLEIEAAPTHMAGYLGRKASDESTGEMKLTDIDISNIYSSDYLCNNLYGQNGQKHKDQGNGDISVGQIAVPTTRVPTMFFKDTDGEYKIGQFWEVDIYDADDNGKATGDYNGTKYIKMPTTRTTHNMPNIKVYNTRTQAKKNKMAVKGYKDEAFKPNINPEYKTKILKNAGSQKVNTQTSAPTNIGFYGTYNEDAMIR